MQIVYRSGLTDQPSDSSKLQPSTDRKSTINIELENENDVLIEAIIYGGCIYGFTLHGKLVTKKKYPIIMMRFKNSIIEEKLRFKQHFQIPWKTYMVTYGDGLMVLIRTYSYLSNGCGRVLDFEIFRADFTKRSW